MAKSAAPQSYAEAITQAQQIVSQGRLNDPGEHFPYKADHARALIEENPPAGPNGPDDDSVRVQDVLSQSVADATEKYIAAQEAFLREPGPRTQREYDAARDYLLMARKHHRRDRVDADGNPRMIINGVK